MQRNLAWLLPVVMFAVMAVFALLFWQGFRQMGRQMQDSEPYREAMARASSSPEAEAMLGRPLRASSLLSVGGVNRFDGSATLQVRIEGPKGRGWLSVRAHASGGQWRYDELLLGAEGDAAPVDLRDDRDRHCAALMQCR